jgi:hypothetical protein
VARAATSGVGLGVEVDVGLAVKVGVMVGVAVVVGEAVNVGVVVAVGVGRANRGALQANAASAKNVM